MASKKRIQRQLQRRRRIERDAVTAQGDQQRFVEEVNGKKSLRKDDSVSSWGTGRTDTMARGNISMNSVINSVPTSWIPNWAGKRIFPSAFFFINVASSDTILPAASKTPMISFVLIVSLIVGNCGSLMEATGIILPSVSTSALVLYSAISIAITLTFLLVWIIYNGSKINETSNESNAVQNDHKAVDDEFAVIRPLGLKPPLAISITDDKCAKESPKAQLASSEYTRTKLAEWLPFGLRYTSDLNLVFSTSIQGRSLQTLYHILETTSSTHTVLLLEAFSSHSKHIIGAYASQRWHSSSKIYGDGRCFLFRLSLPEDDQTGKRSYSASECWKWTPPTIPNGHLSTSTSHRSGYNFDNENDLSLWETFQRSNHDFLRLGIGSSGVGAGLQLNHDLTSGESHRAVGFENEPLCGSQGDVGIFEVGLVQVYQLVREIDGRPIQ